MVDEEEDLDFITEEDIEELERKTDRVEAQAQRMVNAKQIIDDADESGVWDAMPRGWSPDSVGAPISVGEGKLLGFKKGKQIGGGVKKGGDSSSRSPASRESWAEKQKEIEERIRALEESDREQDELDEILGSQGLDGEQKDQDQDKILAQHAEQLKQLKSTANQVQQKSQQMMNIFGRGGKGVPQMLTKGIQGKMLGLIGKLGGPWGMIIAFLIEFAITYITMMYNFIMDEIKGMFKPGGPYDVRKLVRDEAKQYQDLENLMKIKHGEVFFTSNTSEKLRQGTPTGTTYMQEMGESMQQYIKTHDTDNGTP